jgi:hypothetical protein
MMQARDLSYLTAHFIAREMDHLARMIRSRHWHGSKTWTVAYWRQRMIELRAAPAMTSTQALTLDTLLIELECVAAELANAFPQDGSVQKAHAIGAIDA